MSQRPDAVLGTRPPNHGKDGRTLFCVVLPPELKPYYDRGTVALLDAEEMEEWWRRTARGAVTRFHLEVKWQGTPTRRPAPEGVEWTGRRMVHGKGLQWLFAVPNKGD